MIFLPIILSLIPGILISLFIIRQDKYEDEPKLFLAISFAMGMVCTLFAYFIEKVADDQLQLYGQEWNIDLYENIWLLLLTAFIITALTEEGLKFLMLLIFPYHQPDFNEPIDGIIYSVMIAMGFATVENVFYAYQYGSWEITLVRAFTAVPAHAVFGIIIGYYAGLAKFNKENQIRYLLTGFLIAVFVHGLYDFFIIQEYEPWLMIVATLVLVGGLLLARKFILNHQKDSPFKKQETESVIIVQENANAIDEEENEILSAVLFEMKGKNEEE